MKNTTFRKKALLSSVAMLLVALVALGSATFAWFSSNKTVTADGMTVKAAAAQGLVISDDNWNTQGNESEFTTPGTYTLTPISLAYDADTDALSGTAYYPSEVKKLNGGKWSTTDNADFSGWTAVTAFPAPSDAKGTEACAKTTYFADYEVQIKSTGDTVKGVKGMIKFTNDSENASDFIRIAVYNKDGKVVAVLGNEDPAEAIITTTPTVATQTLTSFENGQWVQFVSGVEVSTEQEYKIRVWYEGQDGDCVDEAQQATGSIELKFTYDSTVIADKTID